MLLKVIVPFASVTLPASVPLIAQAAREVITRQTVRTGQATVHAPLKLPVPLTV